MQGFLLLAITALVAMPTLATTTSTTTTTTNTTTNTTATTAPQASFCEICRDQGNCAQAYKGSPGIFCGAWLNAASQRMACCCPATGQCAKTPSNYECMCQGGAASGTTKPKSAAMTTAMLSTSVALVAAGVVVAVADV